MKMHLSPLQLQQNRTPQSNSPEWMRLKLLKKFEEDALQKGYFRIAGVDEAGRGPLAGPVVAAACLIPVDLYISDINDSKKLSVKDRKSLFDLLTTHPDVEYGVGIVSCEEIDQINILQASIRAMIQAVNQLTSPPDYLLVDGLQLPHQSIPSQKIIRGDALSFAIAAASIIAKETRDEIMKTYHEQWPSYGFDSHKGYGTRAHMEAIMRNGPCPIHRKTFEPIKSMMYSTMNSKNRECIVL